MGLGNFLITLKDQRNHQRSGKRSWGKALSSLDLSRDAHDAVDWNPVKGLRPQRLSPRGPAGTRADG